MRRGLDWYRRDPIAFLGGVQGLTAKEIAVYTVALDLIYQHGGAIHNDPRWLAGWIDDMGPAAVRTTVSSLIAKGKLSVTEDGNLTQKRAQSEVKTRENHRETNRKNARIGGERSGETRRANKENKDLSEANASSENEQIREEKNIYPPNPPNGGHANGDLFLSRQALDEAFARFWSVYPKKVAKPKAKERFDRILKRGQATAEVLITGAERYAAEVARRQPAADGRVPMAHPTTWLNEGRWQDEYTEPPARASPAPELTPEQRDHYRELARQRQKERQH